MKGLAEQTLYEVLEVPLDASATEIERAYERARSLYGPGSIATYTLLAPDEAALLDRRLEEARSVLLDPTARAGYDARLANVAPARAAARPDGGALPAAPPPGREGRSVTPVPLSPPFAAASPPPSPPALPPRVAPMPGAEATSAGTPAPVAPTPARPEPVPAAAPAQPRAPARPPESELFVPEGTAHTGAVLRRVREARGLTLAQLAERTRITRYHLENLESDRHDKLPVAVYLRGILLMVAKELRLDGPKVAKSYLDHMASAKAGHGAKPK